MPISYYRLTFFDYDIVITVVNSSLLHYLYAEIFDNATGILALRKLGVFY